MTSLIKLVKELREITGAGILECKKALVASKNNLEAAIKLLKEKGIAKANKKKSRIASEGIIQIVANKNKALIFEVNTETDFVAKNKKFIELINVIGKTLFANDPKDLKEALALKVNSIDSINSLILTAIASIGEKISLRRFQVLKVNNGQGIGSYVHNYKNGVILLVEGNLNEEDGLHLAMHVSAMNPKFISFDFIPKSYIKEELEILRKKTLLENKQKPEAIIEKIILGKLQKQLGEICFLDQKFIINSDKTIKQFLKEKDLKVIKMFRYEVGEGIENKKINFATEVINQVNKK